MKINCLSDTFFVSPQVKVGDLQEVKARGFKSLLINRPDGESWGQPSSSQIEEAAAKLHIKTVYVPYKMGQNPLEVLPDFQEALANLEGPTLAFCRSGTRSAILWALSEKGKRPTDEILKAAQAAGYDLSKQLAD